MHRNQAPKDHEAELSLAMYIVGVVLVLVGRIERHREFQPLL